MSHVGKKDSNGRKNSDLQNVESWMHLVPFLILRSFCVCILSSYREPNIAKRKVKKGKKIISVPKKLTVGKKEGNFITV